MLNWIVTFFLFLIVSAVFGFSGVKGAWVEIARFLAGVFLVLFVASLAYWLATANKRSKL